jgi:hypothetical protein
MGEEVKKIIGWILLVLFALVVTVGIIALLVICGISLEVAIRATLIAVLITALAGGFVVLIAWLLAD